MVKFGQNHASGPSQGGDFGGFSPPMFGRTVNPISTRGADYAQHSTTSPFNFSDLATALKAYATPIRVTRIFNMCIGQWGTI